MLLLISCGTKKKNVDLNGWIKIDVGTITNGTGDTLKLTISQRTTYMIHFIPVGDTLKSQ